MIYTPDNENSTSHYTLRHNLPSLLGYLVYISLAFFFLMILFFMCPPSHAPGSLMLSKQLLLVALGGSSFRVPELISIGPDHPSRHGCTLSLQTQRVLGTSVARGISKLVGS